MSNWEIAPKLWGILASWGLAVIVVAALLSYWIWSNENEQSKQAAVLQREATAKAAQVQLEQDRAMCAMTGIFLTGPEPVAGPAGDRSRSVRQAMMDYRATLRCDQIGS